MRILRSIPAVKLRGKRAPCSTCKGRRVVVVDTWPVVTLARCPSCNGTNPTARSAHAAGAQLIEARRAA